MAMGLVAIVVVLLDLIIKNIATAALGPDAERHAWWLFGDVIGFEYVQNTGAAFGMLRGNASLLAALSLVAAVGLVWLIVQELGPGIRAALSGGLLIGGWFGNLVERIGDGYVTDFVAIGPWPRFNVADSAITIAIVIFASALVFGNGPVSVEGDDGRPIPDGYGRKGEGQRDRQS
jgi:signal peptidase II